VSVASHTSGFTGEIKRASEITAREKSFRRAEKDTCRRGAVKIENVLSLLEWASGLGRSCGSALELPAVFEVKPVKSGTDEDEPSEAYDLTRRARFRRPFISDSSKLFKGVMQDLAFTFVRIKTKFLETLSG
jgi:hypothetical protein